MRSLASQGPARCVKVSPTAVRAMRNTMVAPIGRADHRGQPADRAAEHQTARSREDEAARQGESHRNT